MSAYSPAAAKRRNPVKRLIFGKPKDPLDPKVFHQVSLVAFLAWVGLGSDGLSSAAYGPEEAFRALGDQHYLAVANPRNPVKRLIFGKPKDPLDPKVFHQVSLVTF